MEFLGVSWCFGNHSWFAFVVGPKQKGQKMMMMMMVVVVVWSVNRGIFNL